MVKYLSNSYGGVGEKTAESLVDALGAELWQVLQTEPSRVEEILPAARAEKVLEGWKADFARRRERHLKKGDAKQEGEASSEGLPSSPEDVPEAATVGSATPLGQRGRRTRGDGFGFD